MPAKAIRKKILNEKQRYNPGGDIKESEGMQIEALKEAYEELKEMYGEVNISADPRRRDNAHLHCDFCAADRGIIVAKDDRRQRKCAGLQEKFQQCKKGCLALNLHV